MTTRLLPVGMISDHVASLRYRGRTNTRLTFAQEKVLQTLEKLDVSGIIIEIILKKIDSQH